MKKKIETPALVGVSPDKQEFLDTITQNEAGYDSYLENMSPERKKRIFGVVSHMKTGSHAIAPTICMGPEKCLWYERCPVPERDAAGAIIRGDTSDYPMGRSCVLETYYMKQQIWEYAQHLDIDFNDPVEKSIVNELALIDLYKNRATMILSSGDRDGQGRDFMRIDVGGFGTDAEGGSRLDMKTYKSALHPAFDVIEKLERRRERWLEKLVQTRKDKEIMRLKAGGKKGDSKLLTMIEAITDQLEEMKTAQHVLTDGGDDGRIDFDD